MSQLSGASPYVCFNSNAYRLATEIGDTPMRHDSWCGSQLPVLGLAAFSDTLLY
jgi:hypothetical protein